MITSEYTSNYVYIVSVISYGDLPTDDWLCHEGRRDEAIGESRCSPQLTPKELGVTLC